MKTALKALTSFACAALLSAGTVLPTQAAGRLTVAPTGETAVEETESTEAANAVGLLGTSGYIGFRHGFTHECWSHYYCYAH